MPATPLIATVANDGYIGITFTNSAPVTFNFLKRNGIYIGKTIGSSELDPAVNFFQDYQTKSGEQVSYVGSSFDGTQESAPTAPQTAIVTLSSVWIHKVTKGANGNLSGTALAISSPEGQKQVLSRESNVLRLASEEKPKIKTSPLIGRYIECPIFILREDWGDVLEDFEEMIWSNDLHHFRDTTGESMFFTFPTQEAKFTQFRYSMNLIMVESVYSEAIV